MGGVNGGVKDQFLNLVKFKLGDETQLRFWEDKWLLGNQLLKNRFPSLFNIVSKKQATVFEVFGTVPLNVSFRRSLIGNNLLE